MKWMIFLTVLVLLPNIQTMASGTSSFLEMMEISRFCKDCLIYTGTQVDSRGQVVNKNYQFRLPSNQPLKLHVNLVSANKRPLGFSKARIKVWLVDKQLNNFDLKYDFDHEDFKSSDWGFSFWFEILNPGVYRIEIFDPYDDYMNSALVIVGE